MKTYNKVVINLGDKMGNKFSDFLNTEINDNNKINEKISEKKFENNSNIDTKNVEDLINKYSTYSEKELMQELIKLSNEKKTKWNA